jgi:hypothetical protein
MRIANSQKIGFERGSIIFLAEFMLEMEQKDVSDMKEGDCFVVGVEQMRWKKERVDSVLRHAFSGQHMGPLRTCLRVTASFTASHLTYLSPFVRNIRNLALFSALLKYIHPTISEASFGKGTFVTAAGKDEGGKTQSLILPARTRGPGT